MTANKCLRQTLPASSARNGNRLWYCCRRQMSLRVRTGLHLQLDMPGVAKDRLNIQADKNILTIEGTSRIDMPEGTSALYADVRSNFYRRSFVLSDELEPSKTDASLKDGVLNVRIPKRAEVRPRRIEVRAE